MADRAFYSAPIEDFLKATKDTILAAMVRNNPYDLNDLQRDSWIEEIEILKANLQGYSNGRILLEYTIPRMGKRADCVVLCQGIVFVLEFKVGDTKHRKSTDDQVLDYALDLKNFQKSCHDKIIIPIAISTHAATGGIKVELYNDKVAHPIRTNATGLASVLSAVFARYQLPDFDYVSWEYSQYLPTPTIIEAAQALYNNHKVEDITRHSADENDFTDTVSAIGEVISYSRANKKKSIIFVTGVPGAGKTLVGLDLASKLHNAEQEEHAVFLSGNLPLVSVLQEALARDKIEQEKNAGRKITKDDARREIASFIQIIHKYRDEYVNNVRIPTDRVVIFDESQRAWTKEEIASFMARKKGIKGFSYSEPEFLIGTVNRHDDWGVIVCLVGGGQEINKGEAGLPEWFKSLRRSFSDWQVYISENIKSDEYMQGASWSNLVGTLKIKIDNRLHLASSMRSFRSEKVSLFIKQLLDGDECSARMTFDELSDAYPIFITRDLQTAKEWIFSKARGNERYGIFASSNAARLRAEGIYYAKDRSSISPENWFLNERDDIRSSYFLEVVASEFETQGLELDYAIVGWDADYRMENDKFNCYSMSNRKTPPDWSVIRSESNRRYLKNAYRVLLTRARQGFIIFIPKGDKADKTRDPRYYEQTYAYLRRIGIPEI